MDDKGCVWLYDLLQPVHKGFTCPCLSLIIASFPKPKGCSCHLLSFCIKHNITPCSIPLPASSIKKCLPLALIIYLLLGNYFRVTPTLGAWLNGLGNVLHMWWPHLTLVSLQAFLFSCLQCSSKVPFCLLHLETHPIGHKIQYLRPELHTAGWVLCQ